MEDEVKFGEYARTKDGIIFIVDKEKKNLIMNEFMNMRGTRDITNHSFNLIDLIECGDYVNGYKVIDVMENLETGELNLEMESSCPTPEFDCQLYNKDIKSIVTHQQFKSIEYTIHEREEKENE